jgi:O-acetyl-ADP-ribose deacetylase (regulator of RNase III)
MKGEPEGPSVAGKSSQPERLQHYWTNRSVVSLAQGGDPLGTIVKEARRVVLDAVEAGWSGPPFDPFQLATYLRIPVVPNNDVPDARLVPLASTGVCIEFNPNNPSARTRFSVAHELAHTLFPDHAETVRMRGQPAGDDWQLELLCNVAAAEFLMPVGTALDLESERVEIENLLRLRKKFEVSTEALLLRVVKLTNEACAVFAAARLPEDGDSPTFRIDYVVSSRSWRVPISKGFRVTVSTVLSDCTAVGYTSKGTERWSDSLPEFTVESVGIPPYPGDLYPRTMGVLRPIGETPSKPPGLIEVRGDATQPRGSGPRVIAHVVNDTTPNWGAGFPLALKVRWPEVQEDFIRWAGEQKSNLVLGNTHVTELPEGLDIYHMIAQHGYGPSSKPRIRYAHLKTCLEGLAEYALGHSASVHMPRIGTGQARGQWSIVRELIDEALVRQEVSVTVYELPESERPREVQDVLRSGEANP